MEMPVPVPEELCRELESCLNSGPIMSGEIRQLNEDFIGRIKGLKVHIFSNEHPPPHFHVKATGEENSYALDDCTPLHKKGLEKYEKNIRKWHKKNKKFLCERWNELRPSDCSVGTIPVPNDEGSNMQESEEHNKDDGYDHNRFREND